MSEVSWNLDAGALTVPGGSCVASGKAGEGWESAAGEDLNGGNGSGAGARNGADSGVAFPLAALKLPLAVLELPLAALEKVPSWLCFSSTDAIPHPIAADRRQSQACTLCKMPAQG